MKKLIYILLIGVLFIPNIAFAEVSNETQNTSPAENITNASSETIEVTSQTYDKVMCGDLEVPIPTIVPRIVSTVVLIIQIVVPILMIIMGMVDLMKAVTAGKEDEIKKSQQIFLKRLITGAVVFLLILIVKTVVGVVTPESDNTSMWKCVDCFLEYKCN